MSNFENDFSNENILHEIMLNYGLAEKLKSFGFILIDETITLNQQNRGIDFRCESKDGTILNFDEKSRFTIPIYTSKITGTFSLEIANTTYNKRGWFIDSLKITDYYIFLYPILSGKLDEEQNYEYTINRDLSINNSDIYLKGIMGQILNVKKLRNNILRNFDLEKLGSFAESFHGNSNKYKVGTNYFDINFNSIKNGIGKEIYITFSNRKKISEKPLNIIVRQSTYRKISEGEFYLSFKN